MCKSCGGFGVQVTNTSRGFPLLAKCQICKDDLAYSRSIKARYGNEKETRQEKINRLIGRDEPR